MNVIVHVPAEIASDSEREKTFFAAIHSALDFGDRFEFAYKSQGNRPAPNVQAGMH